MPSKGIDVYSYVSIDGFSITFSVPGTLIERTCAENFGMAHLEVEHDKIPKDRYLNFVGRFEWKVLKNGTEVASAYSDINSLTGKLAGGTMRETAIQESHVLDEVIISYGFYDAGHGEAGLTNHDQCYVTVIPKDKHASWMTQLAPPGSEAANKPFSRFVLAAPHDDGMNTMQNCDAVLYGREEEIIAKLMNHIPALGWFSEHMSHSVMIHMLPNIIYGVAITQKDTIPTLLALGARYFEYRPAELLPLFQDVPMLQHKTTFQHACIPGLGFEEFLNQQVEFLDANPGEIVVHHLRWDNVVSECRRPTNDEITGFFDEACATAKNAPIRWGGSECFRQPIDALRKSGTRIIVVIDAEKYDSWTAEAYATLHADPIIARFESMTTEGQENSDITVLQCQATSQSIKEVLIYSVLAANADTSCLTSTKAALDRITLPWIREHALDRLKAERTLVVMNDFLDGATTDVVLELSRKRLEAP